MFNYVFYFHFQTSLFPVLLPFLCFYYLILNRTFILKRASSSLQLKIDKHRNKCKQTNKQTKDLFIFLHFLSLQSHLVYTLFFYLDDLFVKGGCLFGEFWYCFCKLPAQAKKNGKKKKKKRKKFISHISVCIQKSFVILPLLWICYFFDVVQFVFFENDVYLVCFWLQQKPSFVFLKFSLKKFFLFQTSFKRLNL